MSKVSLFERAAFFAYGLAIGFVACIGAIVWGGMGMADAAKSELNASFDGLITRDDLANAVETVKQNVASNMGFMFLSTFFLVCVAGIGIACWSAEQEKKVNRIDASVATIEAAVRRDVAEKKEDDRSNDCLDSLQKENADLKQKNERLTRILRETKAEISFGSELSIARVRNYFERVDVVALCE